MSFRGNYMRKLSLFVVFILLSCAYPVYALEITPNSVTVDIPLDSYITKEINFNNPENHTVNISLSSSLPISFSKTYFTLENHSSENITLYIFGEGNKNGFITVEHDGDTSILPVTIDISLETTNGTLMIYPHTPKSGKSFIIALPEPLNVSGFIWLNEEIIPIEFKHGFTVIQLDKTEYGDAQVWIYNEGFVQTFEIDCGIEGTVFFSVPSKSEVGEITEISLMLGTVPLNNVEIDVVDPDNNEYILETDDSGHVYPILDKIGEWTIRTVFRERQYTKKINVDYKSMTVSINKETVNIGEYVVITTDETNCDINIKREGVSKFQTTVVDGTLEYSPLESGTYTVTVTSGNKKGSSSFSVNVKTDVRIYDKNNMLTSVLKQNNEYIIQIVDDDNNPITIYTEIIAEHVYDIENENGDVFTIPLANGVGLWKPQIYGNFRLTIPDMENYIGNIMIISIEQTISDTPFIPQSNEDMTYVYVLIAVILIVFFVILLWYLNNKGIIDLPKRKKNIPDKLL